MVWRGVARSAGGGELDGVHKGEVIRGIDFPTHPFL